MTFLIRPVPPQLAHGVGLIFLSPNRTGFVTVSNPVPLHARHLSSIQSDFDSFMATTSFHFSANSSTVGGKCASQSCAHTFSCSAGIESRATAVKPGAGIPVVCSTTSDAMWGCPLRAHQRVRLCQEVRSAALNRCGELAVCDGFRTTGAANQDKIRAKRPTRLCCGKCYQHGGLLHQEAADPTAKPTVR